MRISTNTQFWAQLDLIEEKNARIATLQYQAATGNKLKLYSDDAALGSRIQSLSDNMTEYQGFESNTSVLSAQLSLVQNSANKLLSSALKIMDDINSAKNDTKNNQDRLALATELQGVLSSLLNESNLRDVNGGYLYSGTLQNTSPFQLKQGSYQYQGTSTTIQVSISQDTQQAATFSGWNVFGNIGTGNGQFQIQFDPTHNTGNAYASGITTTSSQPVSDTYTLNFVTNAQGQLAYTVTGAQSGQVVPPASQPVPQNAPAFTSDQAIQFNGLSFQLSGVPKVGDQFTVSPSQKDNVFNQLSNLVNLLKTPVNTDQDKANLQQNLNNALDYFKQFHDQSNGLVSQTGITINYLNSIAERNKQMVGADNLILVNEATVKPENVIPMVTQELQSLEILTRSFSKIQEILGQIIRF